MAKLKKYWELEPERIIPEFTGMERPYWMSAQGHIKGSLNIPLNNLLNQIAKIKKDKPVITCCASGMRSARAKSILLDNGFSQVFNGGGWRSLQDKIK